VAGCTYIRGDYHAEALLLKSQGLKRWLAALENPRRWVAK